MRITKILIIKGRVTLILNQILSTIVKRKVWSSLENLSVDLELKGFNLCSLSPFFLLRGEGVATRKLLV